MRFVNETNYVMQVPPLAIQAGPGEEIDWPDWTPADGPITGFRYADPVPGAETGQGDDDDPAGGSPEAAPRSTASAAKQSPAPKPAPPAPAAPVATPATAGSEE